MLDQENFSTVLLDYMSPPDQQAALSVYKSDALKYFEVTMIFYTFKNRALVLFALISCAFGL